MNAVKIADMAIKTSENGLKTLVARIERQRVKHTFSENAEEGLTPGKVQKLEM